MWGRQDKIWWTYSLLGELISKSIEKSKHDKETFYFGKGRRVKFSFFVLHAKLSILQYKHKGCNSANNFNSKTKLRNSLFQTLVEEKK